jgi:hypothetical protein
MINIAYGRFVIVHRGHEKLFKEADIVLLSGASPEHARTLNCMYLVENFFRAVSGSPFRVLANYQHMDINLIVGQDNEFLAKSLLKTGIIKEYQLIDREEGAPSSSAIRREYDATGTVSLHWFSSPTSQMYALVRLDTMN